MYVLNVYSYVYDNLYTYLDISEIISDGSSLSGLNFFNQKPHNKRDSTSRESREHSRGECFLRDISSSFREHCYLRIPKPGWEMTVLSHGNNLQGRFAG